MSSSHNDFSLQADQQVDYGSPFPLLPPFPPFPPFPQTSTKPTPNLQTSTLSAISENFHDAVLLLQPRPAHAKPPRTLARTAAASSPPRAALSVTCGDFAAESQPQDRRIRTAIVRHRRDTGPDPGTLQTFDGRSQLRGRCTRVY